MWLETFTRWIWELGKVMGPIRKAEVKKLLGKLPDILWEWVEATDSQLRADGARKV